MTISAMGMAVMPARWAVHAAGPDIASCPNPTIKKDEGFDAEELCRRLRVQERRQVGQEQRRRRRATECQTTAQQYHHIPQVAASDFARTATPDDFRKKDIYTLSQLALQKRKEGRSHSVPMPGPLSASRLARALEVARAELENCTDRNQLQWDRALAKAAAQHKEQEVDRPVKRDFSMSHPVLNKEACDLGRGRDHGTGHVVWDEVDGLFLAKPKAKYAYRPDDHPDWAQADENQSNRVRRRSFREVVSPLFKKPESMWSLRNKERAISDDEIAPESLETAKNISKDTAVAKPFSAHWHKR